MKTLTLFIAALLLGIAPSYAIEIGESAPDFTGTNILSGQDFRLSDHKGKIVVLEWTNHLCPFVVKHYETGNMQKVQKAATDQGVEWVSIVSSAPGKQGNVTAEAGKQIVADAGAAPSAKILDESGEIGRLYGAQTTPHMFVINADGQLVYAGAIDDNSSPGHDTVDGAKNYVLAALADLAAGQTVETPTSQPYGCAVKYAH
jgi:peroxiredoxin